MLDRFLYLICERDAFVKNLITFRQSNFQFAPSGLQKAKHLGQYCVGSDVAWAGIEPAT